MTDLCFNQTTSWGLLKMEVNREVPRDLPGFGG